MTQNYFLTTLLFITTISSNAQNIGVGTTAPVAPLHLKSTSAFEMLRIEGNNPYISLFDNAQGYRGYVWFNGSRMEVGTPSGSGVPVTIAPNVTPVAYFTSLGRMGLGVSNPTEKLDVNGNINLSGVLRIDGVSGTAGQVLTSNGGSSPSWQNSSFSNNIRFALRFSSVGGASGTIPVLSTYYNLNTSAVVVGTNSITINQSGLYRFQGKYYATVEGAVTYVPEYNCDMAIAGPSSLMFYAVCGFRQLPPRTAVSNSHHDQGDFSIDLYIENGSTITFSKSFSAVGYSSTIASVDVWGYLISQ